MLKFASTHNIEKKGEVILRKTREGIREELGMTVKTINRTITKMKEAGLTEVEKDKIRVDAWEFKKAVMRYRDQEGTVHELSLIHISISSLS